jgi:hypothetical protein
MILAAILGVTFAWLGVRKWPSSNTQVLELASLALVVTGAMVCSFWIAIFMARNVLLVTDRRVIHRSGWWKETITAIPLDEIRALTRQPGIGLEIQGKDGQEIIPLYCKRPDKLAQAVARAVGLASPDLPGGKERLVQALIDYVHALAMSVSFCLLVGTAAVLLLRIKSIGWNSFDVLAFVLCLVGLVGSLMVYFAICLLGWMVVIASARSFLKPDEMRAFLCRDAEVSWANQKAVSFFLRFASLLYGQPLRCEGSTDKA